MTKPLSPDQFVSLLHAEADRLAASLEAVNRKSADASAALRATETSIVHGERDAAREVVHGLASLREGLTYRRTLVGQAALIVAATPLVTEIVEKGEKLFEILGDVSLGELRWEPSLFSTPAAAALAALRSALSGLSAAWVESALPSAEAVADQIASAAEKLSA